MQDEMLMGRRAQQTAIPHTVHKAEPSSCEAAFSIPCKENGYLVTMADGKTIEMAAHAGADEYNGARRLLVTSPRMGPIRRDSTEVGCSYNADVQDKPLPVLVEGKAIDLVQLSREVAKEGGYERVTSSSAWSMISNRLGFGLSGGAALKFVFVKYLRSFENRKKCFKNGLYQNVDCWVAKNGKQSSLKIIGSDLTGNGDRDLSSIHLENSCETPSKRRRLNYLNEDAALRRYSDSRLPISTGDSSVGSFIDILEWLRRLALSPGDPKKGQGPRGSNQNEAWVQECETTVMRARSILWGRKELIYYGGLATSMSKQKLPPAIYYRELSKPNTRTLEKLRANQTRAMKCGLHLSADSMELQQAWQSQTCGEMLDAGNADLGPNLSVEYLKSMNEVLNIGYLLSNNATRKRIPIGVHFQAQVPACTEELGKERFSDAEQSHCERFGGFCVWPPIDTKISFDLGKVGKGRPGCCSCPMPMSMECVRLHVLEERERLKNESGEAFFHWGFDNMGEAVSARWTDKEERVFTATVRMNPYSMEKNFWDDLPTVLPSKTTKGLVSYYFNVFVVRRRAVENRVMPDSIDSDDDEREFSASVLYANPGKTVRGRYASSEGLMSNTRLFTSSLPC